MENLGEEGKTFLKVNSNNTAQHLFHGYATKQRKTDVLSNAPVSLQTQVLSRAAAAHRDRRDAPTILLYKRRDKENLCPSLSVGSPGDQRAFVRQVLLNPNLLPWVWLG